MLIFNKKKGFILETMLTFFLKKKIVSILNQKIVWNFISVFFLFIINFCYSLNCKSKNFKFDPKSKNFKFDPKSKNFKFDPKSKIFDVLPEL